jgi:pyruvate dehydrogenase E1 component beta subunit
MTGVPIGSALVGMRPVMTHSRIDFAILAVDQTVNQASKWYYMFGGQAPISIVIRMVIGRGWGPCPQHSQSLQSWFAHVPGLKMVMPTTPALSSLYYPRANDMALLAAEMLGIPQEALELPEEDRSIPLDVPDPTFTGPF